MQSRTSKIDIYDFDGTINTVGLNSFPFGLDLVVDDADISNITTPDLREVMLKQCQQHTQLYILTNHPFHCVIHYFLRKMLGETAASTIKIYSPTPEEVLTGLPPDKSFLKQRDESDKTYASRVLEELSRFNQVEAVQIKLYDKLQFIEDMIEKHGKDAVYFYIDDRVNLLEDALERFDICLFTVPAIQSRLDIAPDFVKLLNEIIHTDFVKNTKGMLLPGRYLHFIKEKKISEGHYSDIYEAKLIGQDCVSHIAKEFKSFVNEDAILEEFRMTSFIMNKLVGDINTPVYSVSLINLSNSYALMQPKLGHVNLIEKLKSLHASSSLTFEMKIACALKATEALSRLHFLQIVHGDPGLANFVLDKGNNCYLIDYGKSCFIEGNHPNSRINGFSPEDQAPDEVMHCKTDVFLFAKTLQMILLNRYNVECGYIDAETDIPPPQTEALETSNQKWLKIIDDEESIPKKAKPALKQLLLAMRAEVPDDRPMLMTGNQHVYASLIEICPEALFFQQMSQRFYSKNTLFALPQANVNCNTETKKELRPQ